MIVLFEGRDTAGKIAFFDCSCFGRAGVERVMGSCKPLEYLEFLRQSPAMERMLDRWDDYTEAKKAMFFHTDTADAPWTVIKSDDKSGRVSTAFAALYGQESQGGQSAG